MSRRDAPPAVDARRIRRARRALLAHYDRHARDLPWRRTDDPYAIWVSEVMLQQTRVETVRARWASFLERFPAVEDLAAASEQEVLKAWEGLGYYRRARALRAAARRVVDEHGGRLPQDADALRALPGFGAYTAAAVASIAFDRPAAVVDGNVVRVLTRWQADGGDVSRSATRRRVADLAGRLLDPERPGDANQALMELGATLCTPRAPACDRCPLGPTCRAAKGGEPTRFPVKPPRRRTPHHDVAAGLVWRGDKVLVARRPADGLLGGLWELPGGKRREGESIAAACVREIREETGLQVRAHDLFGTVDHAYTHFRITLHVLHCTAPRGTPRPLACEAPRFVPLDRLDEHPFPRANRRLLDRLLAGEGPPPPTAVARRAHAARTRPPAGG